MFDGTYEIIRIRDIKFFYGIKFDSIIMALNKSEGEK